jgi:predicted DsbA family dithiol-disulfide isomerase
MARQSGISGVPYFIFDRRYALAGAQEPASFLPLFDALAAIDDPIMASSL